MNDYTPQQLKPTDLRPHADNYREHPPEQIEHICASIRRHGFYKNVVVAKDLTILAGHGAVLAALELGLETVPVIRLDIEPDSSEALRVLAGDNLIQQLAVDDHAGLAEVLRSITEDSGGDLEGTGFSPESLESFLKAAQPPKEITEDEVPEPPADPVTKPGDLWLLGAYWECEDCGKTYDYEEGKEMQECPCG